MDRISLDYFQKVDIRIGTVVSAKIPEWSHDVIKLTVDLGTEIGKRIIFAGIMEWYKPKDIKGKQFPFVVNIEPKKIGPEGDYSNGMMLAVDVSEGENKRCILFALSEKVPAGTKVK